MAERGRIAYCEEAKLEKPPSGNQEQYLLYRQQVFLPVGKVCLDSTGSPYMNIRLLCGVFIKIILSVIFSGIFYTAWLAVFIAEFRLVPSEAEGSGLDSILLKAILWLAGPVVTALGFTTGVFIFELLSETRRKSETPQLYNRGIFTRLGETRRSIPSFAVGYGGLPFSHSSTGFHPWLSAKAGKFLNIFKWSLAGCAIGAGSVVWFGPMLIVFGMFVVGTAGVALREVVRIRKESDERRNKTG